MPIKHKFSYLNMSNAIQNISIVLKVSYDIVPFCHSTRMPSFHTIKLLPLTSLVLQNENLRNNYVRV